MTHELGPFGVWESHDRCPVRVPPHHRHRVQGSWAPVSFGGHRSTWFQRVPEQQEISALRAETYYRRR